MCEPFHSATCKAFFKIHNIKGLILKKKKNK